MPNLTTTLALMASSAALLLTTTTSATPTPTPTTCSIPSKAWCAVEGSRTGGFFGRKRALASPSDCRAFCDLPRRWGTCRSFSFSSEDGTCWIHDSSAASVAKAKPGTGVRYWDESCYDCDDTPTNTATSTAAAATSTCLPSTALCQVEAKLVSGSAWGTAEGETYPYACWEGCTDHASKCKAFTWEPSTETCRFYDSAGIDGFDLVDGTGVWLWDLSCWTCGVSGYM